MDISFKTEEGKFNFRVCAVVISGGRLLVTMGGAVDYYYLPGGRVQFGESAQQALLREIREEIGVNSSIVRPLWLAENFFGSKSNGAVTHEISLYYLVNLPSDCILYNQNEYILSDSASGRKFTYLWVELSKLKDMEFYPEFIKKSINNLPQRLTMITNDERN